MESTTSPSSHPGGPSGSLSPHPSPVLVGRTREQSALREELAAAIGRHGRLVLIGGEAGIGKTTLVRDLTRATETLGVPVLTGSCFDLTNTPPYGPWLDLFEGCERDADLPPPPDWFAGGQLKRVPDQAALFAAVRQFFVALISIRPACVILEDLHWADPASLDLLRHIGPHLRHWPVLVLVTYRADELAPNRPFAQYLPVLVREADGRRLDLRRLDTDAVRALVASGYRLTGGDENRLVSYLERHAEGNPFFATELLRTLEEDTLLRRADDGWTLAALDRVIVPSLLRQVIDGRMARLGEETRKALAIAAVIGQEIPLTLWAEVAELDDEALLAVVEHAVEVHVLEAERDGTRVRFVHALTREALYEGILPPRRRLWHRRVAATVMATAQADPDVVAFHLQEAGDPRAWEWLVKAGDRAQRAYAWLTAAERFGTAAALLEHVEGQERSRCRLARRIGWLKRFSDPAGAIAAVDQAARVAARIGDAFMVAELGWVRGVLLMYSDRLRAGITAFVEAGARLDAIEAAPSDVPGMPTAAQAWFDEALPGAVSSDSHRDDLATGRFPDAGQRFRRSALLWQLASAGQLGTETDDDEQFVARADVPGAQGRIPAAVAFTYHGLAIAHAALGRPDEARRAWARARELFAEFDHHGLIAFTLLNESCDVALTYGAAEPATRRRLAEEAEAALGRAGGALHPGVSPRLAWLGCFVLDGRWVEALQLLDDLPPPGNSYLRREVTCRLAMLARYRGQPELAWAQIAPLLPQGPATEPGNIIHQEGLSLLRLASELCLDAGDLPTARAWLAGHDRWLAWSGSVLGLADGAIAWARYHQATGDGARARTTAFDALGLAATPDQPMGRLAAHRILGEIESAAERQTEAEAHLTTALALADACDVPFERALILLAFAELHLAMGATDEAAILLDEVRRICAPLGAVPTLARADTLAARLPARPQTGGLTQRELDVLRLLVAGRSNPEIAEALLISRDTARTHVANIFRKLDVGNRAEAVDHAHRHGLLASFPPPST
jgi:DNA-binding CsgD family transcriptional regulator